MSTRTAVVVTAAIAFGVGVAGNLTGCRTEAPLLATIIKITYDSQSQRCQQSKVGGAVTAYVAIPAGGTVQWVGYINSAPGTVNFASSPFPQSTYAFAATTPKENGPSGSYDYKSINLTLPNGQNVTCTLGPGEMGVHVN